MTYYDDVWFNRILQAEADKKRSKETFSLGLDDPFKWRRIHMKSDNMQFPDLLSAVTAYKSGDVEALNRFLLQRGIKANIDATEIIAILKLVCAGADVACPIIETL